MMVPEPEKALTAEEASLADRVAHRLHDELLCLLGTLPESVRGGSSLSRYLGLNRATCQRIAGTVTTAQPDRNMLVKMPGVRGLRQFLTAMRAAGADETALAGAEAAVEQYRDLLNRVGGSQSRLAARLSTAPDAGSPGAGDVLGRHRRNLFESAAALCGRSTEVGITLYAYRLVPGRQDRIESFTISGHIGHRAAPDAVPLVVVAGSVPIDEHGRECRPDFSSLDRTPARGRTPHAVLEEFSTRPCPLVTSQGPGGILLQTIDPKAAPDSGPYDLVFGHRPATEAPHPALEAPPVQESWCLQHYPARHMIFDLWLHRDLARTCIPSIDLHLYPANFPAFVDHRWISRFPRAPRLEILGQGAGGAATPSYRRFPDLLAHAFGLVGWPLEDFVGHRCEVDYPIWRVGYCITCDFSRENGE